MNPQPTQEGFLPVADGHTIFFAQYGNPKGPAVVTLHGGPGSKSKPKYVQGHDLEKFQIIIFDQRGCGKSTPMGDVENNTTQKLIEDIERLREHLQIGSWFVSGGSWGSTLALAYAETHPEKVRGLLLTSIFLARASEVEWSFSKEGGIEKIFPDVWERRLEFFKKYRVTPKDASKILLQKLLTSDAETVKDITAGVENWEANLMSTTENVGYRAAEDMTEEDAASVKVFLHYDANGSFLEEDQLLKNIETVSSIPTVIVHGRFDVLCPLESAWALYKRMKNAKLVVLPSSAHRLTAEGEVAKRLAFSAALESWTKN